jgi:hypothetical protein
LFLSFSKILWTQNPFEVYQRITLISMLMGDHSDTHFFSTFVDLPLKIGQPSHLLLLPLHLLMDDFHVPDLLVQLLLECWTGGLSLLASSLSERESLLVCVQWLQCSSPWRSYLLRRHDEGQCLPKVVE